VAWALPERSDVASFDRRAAWPPLSARADVKATFRIISDFHHAAQRIDRGLQILLAEPFRDAVNIARWDLKKPRAMRRRGFVAMLPASGPSLPFCQDAERLVIFLILGDGFDSSTASERSAMRMLSMTVDGDAGVLFGDALRLRDAGCPTAAWCRWSIANVRLSVYAAGPVAAGPTSSWTVQARIPRI